MDYQPFSDPEVQKKLHDIYWQTQLKAIDDTNMRDLKIQDLPLARIKKIMKLDESVRMISAEVPIIFAKAAELLIGELTMRAWWCTEENKRKTLQKSDIALAASRYDQFDFLIDIVPREEIKLYSQKKPPSHHEYHASPIVYKQPQLQYVFQIPNTSSLPNHANMPNKLANNNDINNNNNFTVQKTGIFLNSNNNISNLSTIKNFNQSPTTNYMPQTIVIPNRGINNLSMINATNSNVTSHVIWNNNTALQNNSQTVVNSGNKNISNIASIIPLNNNNNNTCNNSSTNQHVQDNVANALSNKRIKFSIIPQTQGSDVVTSQLNQSPLAMQNPVILQLTPGQLESIFGLKPQNLLNNNNNNNNSNNISENNNK